MMPTLFLVVLLCGFWALLSGQFHNSFLLGMGVLSITSIVLLGRRMGLLDDEAVPVRFLPRALAYIPWLGWQVILANIDVFKRIWSVSPQIDPRMVRVPYTTRHPFVTTSYANSITLTPGTVTVSIDADTLLVHALAEEPEQGLRSGDMERQIKRLED